MSGRAQSRSVGFRMEPAPCGAPSREPNVDDVPMKQLDVEVGMRGQLAVARAAKQVRLEPVLLPYGPSSARTARRHRGRPADRESSKALGRGTCWCRCPAALWNSVAASSSPRWRIVTVLVHVDHLARGRPRGVRVLGEVELPPVAQHQIPGQLPLLLPAENLVEVWSGRTMCVVGVGACVSTSGMRTPHRALPRLLPMTPPCAA
jgi:hypothetical protein